MPPAGRKLQKEVDEYASLLRALKTNATLDLTAHLSQPLTPNAPEHDVIEQPVLLEKSKKRRRSGSSLSLSPSTGTEKKKKAKDTWTRWPLLQGDVYIPEWELADEVHALAKECLIYSSEDSSGSGTSPNTVPDDEEKSPSSHVASLTETIDELLSQTFTLLAAHRPSAASDRVDRLSPMDWQTVLNVLAASSLVHTDVITKVQDRMSKLYSGPPPQAAARSELIAASKRKLELLENDIFGPNSAVIFDIVKRPRFNHSGGNARKNKRVEAEGDDQDDE